jgi:hypothetical protein
MPQYDKTAIAISKEMTGDKTMLNVTAPTVVKASPGKLVRMAIMSPGNSGTLTINDCARLVDARTSNQIYSAPNSNQVAGAYVEIQWPCLVGICISSVPPSSNTCVSYQ